MEVGGARTSGHPAFTLPWTRPNGRMSGENSVVCRVWMIPVKNEQWICLFRESTLIVINFRALSLYEIMFADKSADEGQSEKKIVIGENEEGTSRY